MLMLQEYQAYVDGSGTGSPDLLVLAGFIAPAKAWEAFSFAWQEKLNEAGMHRFKMHEMAVGSLRSRHGSIEPLKKTKY